jgi:hypothetical protein
MQRGSFKEGKTIRDGAEKPKVRITVTDDFYPAFPHLCPTERAESACSHLDDHLPGIRRGRFPPGVLAIQTLEVR